MSNKKKKVNVQSQEQSESQSWFSKGLYYIAVVIAIFTYIYMTYGYADLIIAHYKSKDFVQSNATITKMSKVSESNYHIEYKFVHNGTEFKGLSQYSPEYIVESFPDKYQLNSQVEVYYNPNNPVESLLFREFPYRAAYMISFSTLTLASLWFIYRKLYN